MVSSPGRGGNSSHPIVSNGILVSSSGQHEVFGYGFPRVGGQARARTKTNFAGKQTKRLPHSSDHTHACPPVSVRSHGPLGGTTIGTEHVPFAEYLLLLVMALLLQLM